MSQVMAQAVESPTLSLAGAETALAVQPGLAHEAARLFAEQGVTLGVVEDGRMVHRPIPFDPLPRRIAGVEWKALERGLLQRALALDAFIQDVYGRQAILRSGRIPARLVYGSPACAWQAANRYRSPAASTGGSSKP